MDHFALRCSATRTLLGLALGLPAITLPLASGPARAEPQSVYTQHRYGKCPEGKSPEPGVIEVRRCSGPGGLAVTYTGEPDSAALTFGKAPTPESVDLLDFYAPSDKIEWRGGTAADQRPTAAIVRYKVGKSVGAMTQSRLVVYRLETSGKSCVMAVVKEPGANAKARAIVDKGAATFRCGSKRIEG